MKTNGRNLVIEARLMRSRRRHAFLDGDTSLCGLAHINECDQLALATVSTRLKLYVWPKDDLNYCGRCRICLDARGLAV